MARDGGLKQERDYYAWPLFQGTYWLLCVPFLGVGVEVRKGGCLSAFGTPEVSKQAASMVPLWPGQ